MIAYVESLSEEEAETIVHEGVEFALVLEGEVCYLIDGEEYHLFEGDSIYLDRNVPHKVFNMSSGLAKCLAAIEIV